MKWFWKIKISVSSWFKKKQKKTIWWKITFMDLSNAFSTAFFSVSESHKIIDRISACSSLFKGSAVQVILSQKDSFLHQLIQNMTAYCPLSYSLINRRQLHIFFTQAKTWHRNVCWFSWISMNSPVFEWCDHRIVFFFDLQNNFMVTSWKNWGIQGNSAKSINNPMSSFGLIEENMELSHTD